MPSLLIRLFDIAYVSRNTWPLLISVAFMLADIHFRVELQFEADLFVKKITNRINQKNCWKQTRCGLNFGLCLLLTLSYI